MPFSWKKVFRPVPQECVLFLCTGNYYRSRFAEVLFNFISEKQHLSWNAESRGLALERGFGNIGPISIATFWKLRSLGIPLGGNLRFPVQVNETDLHKASLIIALKEAEHRPLLQARFPDWVDKVEYWHIHDTDCGTVSDTFAGIEREVKDLIGRLKTGLKSKA